MSEPADEPQEPAEEPAAAPEPDEPGVSDDEAAEAEEAEAADEPTTEDEPEPGQPSDVQPESPEDRKRHRAAANAVKTYAGKIAALFPESAGELLGCPLCGETQWPGFVHLGDAGLAPDPVKNAVMQFLGYAREIDYQPSSAFHGCPECGGLGKVRTGSQVAGKETATCPTCNGQGYLGQAGAAGNGVAAGVTGPTVMGDAPSGAGVPDVDPSGEPRLLPDGRENPNYGKWPQYKTPVEPWGVTAGLTVQDAV